MVMIMVFVVIMMGRIVITAMIVLMTPGMIVAIMMIVMMVMIIITIIMMMAAMTWLSVGIVGIYRYGTARVMSIAMLFPVVLNMPKLILIMVIDMGIMLSNKIRISRKCRSR